MDLVVLGMIEHAHDADERLDLEANGDLLEERWEVGTLMGAIPFVVSRIVIGSPRLFGKFFEQRMRALFAQYLEPRRDRTGGIGGTNANLANCLRE